VVERLEGPRDDEDDQLELEERDEDERLLDEREDDERELDDRELEERELDDRDDGGMESPFPDAFTGKRSNADRPVYYFIHLYRKSKALSAHSGRKPTEKRR